jgi:hypothetical protein
MIPLNIDIWERAARWDSFRKRGSAKIMKRVLRQVARYWYDRYLPEHFQPKGATKYHIKPNEDTGRPLTWTGTLRRRMTRPLDPSDITGTSKQVTIRLRYGRPPEFPSQEDLATAIYAEMENRSVPYRTARAAVHRRNAYSREARRAFDRGLRAVHGSDVRTLKSKAARFAKALFDEAAHGPMRRRG